MNDIRGIPYHEARFDKKGNLENSIASLAGITDLYVISHGWNNNADEARTLYREWFKNFDDITKDWPERASRKLCILGVIWPSKALDEIVAAAPSFGGAAGLGDLDAAAEETIKLKLERIKDLFPGDTATIREVAALVPKLEVSGAAQEQFVEKLRSLLNDSAANDEDASDLFFSKTPSQILEDLAILSPIVDAPSSPSAASSVEAGAGDSMLVGGAAGLGDPFSGIKSGAIRFLNYLTYYEMKERAGTVGSKGVAPLLDRLADSVERIHLIGHSFGGRLVSAAAKAMNRKIASMTLLQAAFSHNGFSKAMNGFFRDVVTTKRITGPILVTHTKNDTAVGIAYPLASRLANQVASVLGDENDKFGGMGRNGAQQMEHKERVVGELLNVNEDYAFQPGIFFNLKADKFIRNHGDVAGREVAFANAAATLRFASS
jgi:predicted alpha/beta hydrolase family esterase